MTSQPCLLTLRTARRLAPPLLAAGLLSACAVTVKQPTAASTVATGPVPLRVEVTPLLLHRDTFRVWLAPWQGDGPEPAADAWNDITSSFSALAPVPSAFALSAQAQVPLLPGRYMLASAACWGVNPIYFVMPPKAPTYQCGRDSLSFRVVPPALAIDPASVDLLAGAPATTRVAVRATPAPATDLSVTLSASRISPVTLTLPAGSTGAVNSPPLTGLSAGTDTLTASGTPSAVAATAALTVRPRLSSVGTGSASPGDAVALTGAGWVAPLTLLLQASSAPGTTTTVATGGLSGGNSATATLPTTLAVGSYRATVRSNQQVSDPIAFTVRPPATLLLRSHATGIDLLRFTRGVGSTPGSFARALPATVAATSAGLNVVGLAVSGSTVLRASASTLERYTLGGTPAAPTLVLNASAPSTGTGSAAASGDGVDAGFLPGQLLRATDRGLEAWQPGTAPIAKLGSNQNSAAAASAGISLLTHAGSAQALRSTSGALEVWDLSSAATPVRDHNNIQVFAAPVGSGLAWVEPGTTLVRGHGTGIQVLALEPGPNGKPQTRITGGDITGAGVPWATVAARPGLRQIVRSTGQTLEVWDLNFGANPVLCASSLAGDASASGVALAVDGDVVFRATGVGVEAWDLSSLVCSATRLSGMLPDPVIFRQGLAPATTGLGLAVAR